MANRVTAKEAAKLYDELHEEVAASPIGSVARRLHAALGDLTHEILFEHASWCISTRNCNCQPLEKRSRQ